MRDARRLYRAIAKERHAPDAPLGPRAKWLHDLVRAGALTRDGYLRRPVYDPEACAWLVPEWEERRLAYSGATARRSG